MDQSIVSLFPLVSRGMGDTYIRGDRELKCRK